MLYCHPYVMNAAVVAKPDEARCPPPTGGEPDKDPINPKTRGRQECY
jgi:hypothetical protein